MIGITERYERKNREKQEGSALMMLEVDVGRYQEREIPLIFEVSEVRREGKREKLVPTGFYTVKIALTIKRRHAITNKEQS